MLYWNVGEGEQVTDTEVIDGIGEWATQRCTLSFETLAIWQRAGDGTDVNACDVDPSRRLLAAGDDFGVVSLYDYPAASRPAAEPLILAGHSAHVTDVAFVSGGARLASAGGREASILQWKLSHDESSND